MLELRQVSGRHQLNRGAGWVCGISTGPAGRSRCAKASRSGVLEIIIVPLNGVSS